MTSLFLRLENLRLLYGSLNPLSKKIPLESITWVQGPNGIGKSTLLRTLAGLIPPQGGKIQSPPVGLYFGHQLALHTRLTLEDHMRFWEATESLTPASRKCPWLKDLPMTIPLNQLSYGDQKKAALLRLFKPSPGLWLLDEPFSGLDHDSRSALASHLCTLTHTLLLITSHEPIPPLLTHHIWSLKN